MAIANRRGHDFGWKSPWLIGSFVVAIVILATVGVGFAAGLFRPGGQSGAPIATSPMPLGSPSPSTPGPSQSALACKLPVLITEGTNRYGAWLNTATGEVLRDPAAEGTAVSYSAAAGGWVPAEASGISPDASSYAYGTTNTQSVPGQSLKSQLHIVDIASGHDAVYSLDPPFLHVVSYRQDAIFLTVAYDGMWDVYRFDLVTHTLAQISDVSNLWSTDGIIAWIGSVNPADPHLLQGMAIMPNQVDRVVLATGAKQLWLYQPETELSVVMTDAAGNPLVFIDQGRDTGHGFWVGTGNGELVLLDRPNHVITLRAGAWDEFRPGAVDRYGTWLGGTSGIFLLTPDGTFRNVSPLVAQPAGACQ